MRTFLIIAAAVLLGAAAVGYNPPFVHPGWLGLSVYVVSSFTTDRPAAP